MIFAREINDPLTSLVKTIDKQLEAASVGRAGQRKLGVFVVFCNDDPAVRQQAQDVVTQQGLKLVVLSTHNSAGPPRYRVAREAELTAVIYENQSRVVANFAFEDAELESASAQAITQAIAKVLPKH